MSSRYFLSRSLRQTAALQQARRSARSMGTLAHQYLHLQNENIEQIREKLQWSNGIPFATPESDLAGSPLKQEDNAESEWSHSLSFASPEADFTANRVPESIKRQMRPSQPIDSESLLANPESAFGAIHSAELLSESAKVKVLELSGMSYKPAINRGIMFQEFMDNMALMASPESATGIVHSASMLNEESKLTLLNLQKRKSLPKTLDEALADPRAVVVTSIEEPFDIIEVNEAWVGLCGYDREEAKNQNLGKLLQGPGTDGQEAQLMVRTLRREHFADAMLTNYTKQGRKFQNHVQAGLLSDKKGNTKYFVGVLEEMLDYEHGNKRSMSQ